MPMNPEFVISPIKGNIHLESWGVRISALLTAFTGIINLTSAVQPALMDRLAIIETIFPLAVRHGSRMTSALAGFALLLLASSLWRRKHVAWILTSLFLIISLVTHLIKGLDFEEASLSFGLLILLIVLRYSFHAESDRPSIRQGLLTLFAALGFTLVYGTIGFYFLDRHFSVNFKVVEAIQQTVVMFTSFYDPGMEPITGFGRYFAGSIYVIGVSTLGFALIMLIQPVLIRDPSTADERAHAKAIVEKYGRTAASRSALFEDKSYFFGPGETVIAFAASNRGAIVLGDPFGPSDQIAEAIRSFQAYCARRDWLPAFASTLPDYLEIYKSAGFDAVCIGYEAIVNLEKFTLAGSANKDVRNAVSRIERAGYRAEVHLPPLEDRLISSLREISDAWLTLRKGGEMHFSVGWFEDSYIRNGPVIVIYDSNNSPMAFANLVSEYQKNELTLDLMRHYPGVQNGTMEFMFTRMFQWAKENGYDTFSLGLSAIVGVGEKPDDPRVEQALHTIAEGITRFYNFKGLHKFKEKFHPQWEPRYMVYPGAANLPVILSALIGVHSGRHVLWKYLKK